MTIWEPFNMFIISIQCINLNIDILSFLNLKGTGLNCTKRGRTIKEVLGWNRLVTPSVVKKASKHYNCSDPAITFGAMLETKVDIVYYQNKSRNHLYES